MEAYDEIVVETLVIGTHCVLVAHERERVLLFARQVPMLCRELHALAHRELRARLDDPRKLRLEMPWPQSQPWLELRAERTPASTLHEQRTIGIGIHDRHVADTVRAAGDTGFDESRRNLAREEHGCGQACPASPLQIERRRFRGEPRRQDALASQVVIPRMLDDGAGRHVIDLDPVQVVFDDERGEHGTEHVLVAALRVRAVRAAERCAQASNDCDAARWLITHSDDLLALHSEVRRTQQ